MHRNISLFLILGFLVLSAAPASAMEITSSLQDDGFFLSKEADCTLNNLYGKVSPWLSTNFQNNYRWGIKEAYLDLNTGPLSFSLGRKILTFGPGRYGHLILGPLGTGLAAEGYDQAGYNFTWHKLKYHKFYALVPETGKQMLLGQRATYQLGAFTFGFSETAILNPDAPWFFYLPIPFIPVYAYQHLGFSVTDTPNLNRTTNVLMAANLIWQPNPNYQVYLEYLADDQPGLSFDDNGKLTFAGLDKNPWRVGAQAGLGWKQPFNLEALELYAEYTLIAQYTYTGLDPELSYTYKNHLIGDPLGPDADRLNLEAVYKPTPSWQWNFSLSRERHGEGELGDKWVQADGQALVFLTGVVEKTNTLKISATKLTPDFELTMGCGISLINNHKHSPGKTSYLPSFSLQGTWKNLRLVTQ